MREAEEEGEPASLSPAGGGNACSVRVDGGSKILAKNTWVDPSYTSPLDLLTDLLMFFILPSMLTEPSTMCFNLSWTVVFLGSSIGARFFLGLRISLGNLLDPGPGFSDDNLRIVVRMSGKNLRVLHT